MGDFRRILIGLAAWAVSITGLHLWLNVDWPALVNDYLPKEKQKLNVAYIPVT